MNNNVEKLNPNRNKSISIGIIGNSFSLQFPSEYDISIEEEIKK